MKYNELDVCFIMGLYPKEKTIEIENDCIYGIQNAANVFQWNIIDGMLANDINNIELINSLYIGSFPSKYKKIVIPSYSFNVNRKYTGKNIGFLNIPIIKEYLRFITMKKELKQWATDNRKNKVAIAYAATYPMVKALNYLKSVNSDIKTCLVIPDLPMYMNLSCTKTGILHQIKNKLISREIIRPDSYVLLTEQMKGAILGAKEKPTVVVEGMTSIGKTCATNIIKTRNLDNKYFLYSGTLNYRYGIMDLIKSFERASVKDINLIICGEGEASGEIQSFTRKNNRIHFLGSCSHERVIELQKNAFALINPRRNEGEYTKYSFPSKIIEYMASGRPTIAYLLDGMPKEYKQYLICIENNKDGIKKALEYVAQMSDELCDSFGYAAQKFVLEEKNSQVQMKKVLDMLIAE